MGCWQSWLKQLIRLLSWELSSTKKQNIKKLNDSIALLQQQMVSGESSPARLEVEKAALAAELESVARGAQIRAH